MKGASARFFYMNRQFFSQRRSITKYWDYIFYCFVLVYFLVRNYSTAAITTWQVMYSYVMTNVICNYSASARKDFLNGRLLSWLRIMKTWEIIEAQCFQVNLEHKRVSLLSGLFFCNYCPDLFHRRIKSLRHSTCKQWLTTFKVLPVLPATVMRKLRKVARSNSFTL